MEVDLYNQSNGNTSNQHPSDYWLTVTVTPVLVLLGLLGNTLSILVMRRKKFKDNTTSTFIIVLAMADSTYLLTNYLTIRWISIMTGINIREISLFSCKFTMYLVYVSKALGAWIIVSVSLERLVLVSVPLRVKSMWGTKRTKIWILCLLLIISAIYIYIPILVDVQKEHGVRGCDFSPTIARLNKKLNIFDCIFYSLLPSFILIVLNSILYYMLRVTKQNMSKITNGIDTLRFNATLITLCISYMTLTLPISIYLVIEPPIRKQIHNTIYSTLYSINISNNAINFILYCLSGPIFRNEMKKMFPQRPCCRRMNAVGHDSQTTCSQQS